MQRKPLTTRKKVLIAVVSVLLTLLATLVVLNFAPNEKEVRQEIPRLYSIEDPAFQRSLGILLGPPMVSGNAAQELLNGDQIFPAMLEAIRGAKKNINFETYIYWSGTIGKQFADALAERARAGVKVHLLIDAVGSSKMSDDEMETMQRSSVEVRKYHPLRWYNLGRMNNRTHRKLLIVDGRIGFTGGVGIAPDWTGHAQDPDHWRDSHYRVEGPVVGQVQAVFMDNWTKTTGKVLHGDDYFPEIAPVGNMRAQMFSSSQEGGSESMHLMYLLAITAAKESIRLSASYFVPDEMTRNALVDAMKRGVKVQIITPGKHIDVEAVRRSSRGMWGELLKAGAEISEYEPTMYHCKVMIVDGLLVSVGSTNFDNRSFELNDEANLNVYDRDFAQRQIVAFDEDLKHSHRVSYEEWLRRPLQEKAMEKVASWLGPLL
ncbi:phospholipase D-like domain-containing protein [Noviherbaspirillum pedocola]|uniref:Cardiolipin synthase B n=1 Tax=Noviherbaspirillum pedocola TaxID=2801341 RepID=A0A934SWQ9_9BURK|nr:phospholipase D-like domain-containing protein [Noviherbaspirillum pedocola]MBK4737167.1 cardiolipin synthase B [Noviherbaspirillum pedocola]